MNQHDELTIPAPGILRVRNLAGQYDYRVPVQNVRLWGVSQEPGRTGIKFTSLSFEGKLGRKPPGTEGLWSTGTSATPEEVDLIMAAAFAQLRELSFPQKQELPEHGLYDFIVP